MDRYGPPHSTKGRMIPSPSAKSSSGGTIARDANSKQSQSAILPLPTNVVAQIKSSTAIISLSGVVVELLKNSLDAGATKIEVTVDFVRGGCIVEDNGLGISPTEFREEGGLGKMYCKKIT
jgi:DNA mismatch repair protein MLH3